MFCTIFNFQTRSSRVYKEYLNHKDEEQGKIDRKYDSFTKI